MKTVITKKKNPKATAGVSKQGPPSPIPTTPTTNAKAATKDKKKTIETFDEPKAAGRTGGKTIKFYKVDQKKYVDTTFDKSKDEKV
uniref:Uncharacterized protein n=1 Tax=Panagrolaimus sp. PS1159 TaxID=55785 RepID=A0AC35FR25_9BILA